MKEVRLTILTLFVFVAFFAMPKAFADAADNQQMLRMLKKINTRMQNLQNEVNHLRGQVGQLRQQLHQERMKNATLIRKRVALKSSSLSSSSSSSPSSLSSSLPPSSPPPPTKSPSAKIASGSVATYTRSASKKVPYTQLPPHATKSRATKPHAAKTVTQSQPLYPVFLRRVSVEGNRDFIPSLTHVGSANQNNALTAIYMGGTPIFTSPYIGIHSAFDGSNLIVNASSVNLDLRLLEQHQALEKAYYAQQRTMPNHPMVELSGKVEVQGLVKKQSPGNTTSDLNLATVQLDTYVGLNSYASGFFSFAYDNSATSPIRVENSRFFLRQGFITVGRLMTSPFYASAGQLFVPFGQYSTYMLSDPTTEDLGRARERALVLGFHPPRGLFAAVYLFNGNTDTNKKFAGGGSVGVDLKQGNKSLTISTGYITNIAESEGMQDTNAPPVLGFEGFGKTTQTEQLKHAVPGADVNANIGIGPFNLLTEYVAAIRTFDPMDLSFNGKGARPQTFHIEGVYHFLLYGKPGSVGVGYDFTKQALALSLPHQRYIAAFNISFWRDTIATIEFRHDINYSNTDRASGAGSVPFGPLGSHDNRVTAQFGVYF